MASPSQTNQDGTRCGAPSARVEDSQSTGSVSRNRRTRSAARVVVSMPAASARPWPRTADAGRGPAWTSVEGASPPLVSGGVSPPRPAKQVVEIARAAGRGRTAGARRATAQGTTEQSAEQSAQVRHRGAGRLVEPTGRRRPVLGQHVDDLRQEHREHRQQRADIDARSRRQLLDRVRAERLRRAAADRRGRSPRSRSTNRPRASRPPSRSLPTRPSSPPACWIAPLRPASAAGSAAAEPPGPPRLVESLEMSSIGMPPRDAHTRARSWGRSMVRAPARRAAERRRAASQASSGGTSIGPVVASAAGTAGAAAAGGQVPVPRLEPAEQAPAGQVEVDRGDRDPPVDDRMEVGAGDRQAGRRRAADPEVGDAARVAPLDQLVRVHPPAEAGDLDAFALLEGRGRDVDVDELAARQALGQDVAGHDRRGVAGEREVGMLVVLLRDRECRAVVDDRFHRRADGARVRDVVAEVRAVVDARGDEVEAMLEVAEEGQADRVGRRAVDRVRGRAVGEDPLAHAQRPHQRLLVADRALVGLGCDDRHVAHRLERLLERQQAARLDAVVVGDQDPRARGVLGDGPGRRPQGPRPAPRRAAGQGLASLQVEIAALRAGALAGHVRDLGVARRRRCSASRRPCGSASSRHGSTTSAACPGAGSRGTRTGPAFPGAESLGRAAGDRPVARRAVEEVEEERRRDGGDRDPEDRARDARDLRADQDRPEHDDRVDPDGALHDPRLEHVHDDEPADAHQHDRRDHGLGLEDDGRDHAAGPRPGTGRRTGSP